MDATAAEQGSGRYTENWLIKGWVDRELFKVTAYTGFLSMAKKTFLKILAELTELHTF